MKKGLQGWVEVFRAGRHTDSQGREREFTAADLDRMVAGYDPAKHEAPAVVGHPKDNAPAYGWVAGQCFGTATTTRPRFNIFTLEEDLAEAHYRLAGATIEHLDWREVVRRYDRPHTLFYCDPPYWQVEGYGVDFSWEEYEALARVAKEIEGQMIISINDHPDIRELFKGRSVVEIDHKYTVGGGGNEQRCVELVYGTWPGGVPKPRAMQPGLFG